MFIQNLYERALLDPYNINHAREIFIVSGYASATFANRHLKECEDIKVNLIIGMPGKRSDHLGFLNLYDKYGGRFKGYYITKGSPVHSKVYSWHKDGNPILGFSGSANYSQTGFTYRQQINQLKQYDPVIIREFYDSLLERSVEIPQHDFDIQEIAPAAADGAVIYNATAHAGGLIWEIPNRRVRISFLDRHGELPARSGLNWGQRENREPNQAYLSLKNDARRDGFLPPQTETFTLITDDGQAMDCVVAQQGRKAVQSTNNNSEIGKYIRKRIGVPLGNPVTKQDLELFGRTDYTLEKINDETFLLDLSS